MTRTHTVSTPFSALVTVEQPFVRGTLGPMKRCIIFLNQFALSGEEEEAATEPLTLMAVTSEGAFALGTLDPKQGRTCCSVRLRIDATDLKRLEVTTATQEKCSAGLIVTGEQWMELAEEQYKVLANAPQRASL